MTTTIGTLRQGHTSSDNVDTVKLFVFNLDDPMECTEMLQQHGLRWQQTVMPLLTFRMTQRAFGYNDKACKYLWVNEEGKEA